MQVVSLGIPDVRLATPKKFGDDRGFFSETYNSKTFRAAGIDLDFVQDNHAFSTETWTLRGLHYQSPPYAQDKLVRVVRGSVLDVAVDIRRGSPTYGQHVSAVLTVEDWNQVLVPKGFAHAYLTLEPDTEVIYKVTDYYAPDHDCGLLWNDPDLAIDWPVGEDQVELSPKDRVQPLFKNFSSPFEYVYARSERDSTLRRFQDNA